MKHIRRNSKRTIFGYSNAFRTNIINENCNAGDFSAWLLSSHETQRPICCYGKLVIGTVLLEPPSIDSTALDETVNVSDITEICEGTVAYTWHFFNYTRNKFSCEVFMQCMI
ncbi:MAG: hypothetical protein IJG37_02140 [Synergistaceae bacterium]|nr:hypothetical protein [Synergistaceae bacterium]MBQ7169963.1 hypothetical protein [Synergistaceae bacterium]